MSLTQLDLFFKKLLGAPPQSSPSHALLVTGTRWYSKMINTRPSNLPKNLYVLETWSFLERYRQDLMIPLVVNFQGVCESVITDTSLEACTVRYIDCINRLDLANKIPDYLRCPVKEVSKNKACQTCGNVLTNDLDTSRRMGCSTCGFQETFSTPLVHYSNKNNLTQKYVYLKRTHFTNCVHEFQGTQKQPLPEDFYTRLHHFLESYKLIDHSKVGVEMYHKVEKSHIHMFIKTIRKEHHYGKQIKNVNVIYNKLKDIREHDIQALLPALLEDFDLFAEVYCREIPNDEKRNFNYQLLLYQLLLRHGFPAKPEDFNFLKTTERKAYHDATYKKLFDILGWQYKPCF